MTKPRILFCLKHRTNYFTDDYPGTTHLSSGLYNSANFVNLMLQQNGYASSLVHVVDANSIHAACVQFKADICIIEAFWVPPYKFDDLKKVIPNTKFVVRNHSDIPFMSLEGVTIEWTMEYLKKSNVLVSANRQDTFNDIVELAEQEGISERQLVYLPNYYPVSGSVSQIKFDHPRLLNVGCFGAIRPLKNQLQQAVAAIKYAVAHKFGLNFHINATRIENNASPILKNIRALFAALPQFGLVEHSWMNHANFIQLIKEMDIVMQVSFSETFNIVSADATVSGIPIVVSDQVPWANAGVMAKCDSSSDIVAKMTASISGHYNSIAGLTLYSRQSQLLWLDFLK